MKEIYEERYTKRDTQKERMKSVSSSGEEV